MLNQYNVNVRAENEKRLEQLEGEPVTFQPWPARFFVLFFPFGQVLTRGRGEQAEDNVRGRTYQKARLEAIGVERQITLKTGAQV
eukprot:2086104-Rhodomonas_salina.1